MKELVYVLLAVNKLTGPIPSQLFNFKLVELFLQSNALTGRINQH